MKTHKPINRFLLALAACAAISPGVAHASLITQTNLSTNTNDPQQAAGGFEVSATDLVNQGQATLASATRTHVPLHGQASDFGGNDPNNMGTDVPYANDGQIGDFNTSPWGKSVEYYPAQFFRPSLPVTYTFTLNAALNPNGYDITNITSTCGYLWNKDWCSSQVFQVEITKDNTTWLDLGTSTYKPYTAPTETGNLVTQVVLNNTGGGALNNGSIMAKNVRAIRITYVDPGNSGGGNFDGTAIKEIDVSGQESSRDASLDYNAWAANPAYTGFDLNNPAADADGDGLSNQQEYAFGLDPTKGSSVSPIAAGLSAASGQFSYTRRDPSLTNLTCTVEYSTDLSAWYPVTLSEPESASSADNKSVQTVTVKVSDPSVGGKLFVRVQAQ